MSKVTISIKKKTKKRNILQEESISNNQIQEKKKEESKPKKITTLTNEDLQTKKEQKEIKPIPLPEESRNMTPLQQMINRKKNEQIRQLKDEPTENDYENVSIDDFGLAMLKGMGFKGNLSSK